MSRTGQKIPVVDNVHLHSLYNPFKEAEGLVSGHLELLKNRHEVLILGLGFGYHVNAIAEKLQEIHGSHFKIIVIEPNPVVYHDCLNLELLNKENVLVYPGLNVGELYRDVDLVHFLLKKPSIIAHPPSFNLYQNYFKDFLTFSAATSVKEVVSEIKIPEIKDYFFRLDENKTLENALDREFQNKKTFETIDFLAMAFREMIKTKHDENSGELKL